MICGDVAKSISGCSVCNACRVVCDCCTLHGTQYTHVLSLVQESRLNEVVCRRRHIMHKNWGQHRKVWAWMVSLGSFWGTRGHGRKASIMKYLLNLMTLQKFAKCMVAFSRGVVTRSICSVCVYIYI